MIKENVAYAVLALVAIVLIGVTIGLQILILSNRQPPVGGNEMAIPNFQTQTPANQGAGRSELQAVTAAVVSATAAGTPSITLVEIAPASTETHPVPVARARSSKPALAGPPIAHPGQFLQQEDAAIKAENRIPATGDTTTTKNPADDAGAVGDIKGTITIGARDTTEQLLFGQLVAVALSDAGFEVIDRTGLVGVNSAHKALQAGDVDIIWEYVDTVLTESHGIPPASLPADGDAALQMVSALDARHYELLWLTPAPFSDAYSLLVQPELLRAKTGEKLSTLDELATYVTAGNESLSICVEQDFYSRKDGLFSLQDQYGFAFTEEDVRLVGYEEQYEGLREGSCDIAAAIGTDGRVSAWGFQSLGESRHVFPAGKASPVIRAGTLKQFPEIGDLLDRISSQLDNSTLADLKARIDIGADGEWRNGDEEAVRTVALDFLRQNRLLSRPKIVVGTQDSADQLLLDQILIRALEAAGFNASSKTKAGGVHSTHTALLAGEVDVIWGFVSTVLSESHGIPHGGLPTEADVGLKMVKGLDAHHHDLIWLEVSALNPTRALMVRPRDLSLKTQSEFKSIRDLADYMKANDAPLSLCVDHDSHARGDGFQALQKHYGFEFREENIQVSPRDVLYTNLRDGRCDVAEGMSTDGRVGTWGFQILNDSALFFPANNAAPVVRGAIAERFPAVVEVLNSLGRHLDNETLAGLNARVQFGADGEPGSGDEESVQEAVLNFLASTGLFDQ